MMNLKNYSIELLKIARSVSKVDVDTINSELKELKDFPSREEALKAIHRVLKKYDLYREGNYIAYLDVDSHELIKIPSLKFKVNGKEFKDHVEINPVIEVTGKLPGQSKKRYNHLSNFTFDPDKYIKDDD